MTRILTPFPEPPAAMQLATHHLDIVRGGDPDEMAAAGDLDNLPRPWAPASFPDDLRQAVWQWCDLVALWINTEYAWRPTAMVPPCWPRHAHIAHELPVVGYLRWRAEQATSPELLEDWQRHSFPMFCDRLTARLGDGTCRTGKHQSWPAESRVAAFLSQQATADRDQVFSADTHPPTPRRRAES